MKRTWKTARAPDACGDGESEQSQLPQSKGGGGVSGTGATDDAAQEMNADAEKPS